MHHDMGHHVHMAARDISASGQHAQCGKDYQIYARPVSGLKTVAETNEQGYEQALTSVDFEIPYWPVLPKFESDIGTIQVTIAGMIRYTETMSNKDCKTPLDLMIKSFKSGLIPIEKMPLSKTERLMPLNINTAGKIFTHATWPRCRYIFVPDEVGIMKLVNVVKLRLKPLEEK